MSLLQPGANLIFMRVGTHAGEPFEVIFARKLLEIETTGQAFWGYGGASCHPRSVVQPYGEQVSAEGGTLSLCMQEVAPDQETYWAESEGAREWSIDGINFKDVPTGIKVTGSRYAFVVSNLRREVFDLDLTRVRVAVGPSRGRLGANYVEDIGGRVDKAVLRVEGEEVKSLAGGVDVVGISYVADIRLPYAVFLR